MNITNTSVVYARIDAKLKENAEDILTQLGITPSSAIQMLYSQVVLTKGMPFDLRIPDRSPTAIAGMTKEQLDEELRKGWESLKTGKSYTVDEVDEMLKQRFGIE